MTMQITDRMFEVAWEQLIGVFALNAHDTDGQKDRVRAALEAAFALAVADAPSPMVAFALNVELKSLQDEVDAALRDGNSYVAEGLIKQERQIQTAIRKQVAGAPVAGDANLRTNAGDAEFEAALDEYGGAAHHLMKLMTKTRRFPSASETESLNLAARRHTTARQHVLALHRRERMAGLRELREWIGGNGARYDAVYDFAGDIADVIDAMLNGGDDDQ